MSRLQGKVALVTGGARGIGAATARALAAQGAKVVIGDIRDAEGQAFAAELSPSVAYVPLDVTKPADWDKAVSLAVERFGGLNVLVNNAGVAQSLRSIEKLELAVFEKVLTVNVTGVFNGVKAVTPSLRAAGGGSIVNISSISGLYGTNGTAAYTASKFAVRGLTKTAAMDLGRYGIRVNSVHPGLIDTDMAAGVNYSLDHLALRRIGEPSEIGGLVVFLASDESSFCPGAEFAADGGDSAGRVLR